MTQPHLLSLGIKRKKIYRLLFLVIPAILGFLITLTLIHFLLFNEDKKNLNSDLDKMGLESRILNSEIMSALSSAKSDNSPLCSQENLNKMRRALWRDKYIKDIAHIKKNQIICSASWGTLKNPISLQKESKIFSKNFKHWKNTPDPITKNTIINMLSIGHTLILIKKDLFNKYYYKLNKNNNVAFELKTFNYIFRHYGNISPETLIKAKTGTTLTSMTKKSCANKDQCIIIKNNKMGLLGTSDSNLLIAIIVSIISGLTLSYILFLSSTRHRSQLQHLKRAINNGDIYLEYQPKLCLVTHEITGVEALARWHDKTFGRVSPDVFIGLAEKHDLMEKLSHLVVHRAFQDMSPIMKKYPDISLSINLSMKDISQGQILCFINEQAERHHIAHDRVIFEVTERTNDGVDLIEKSVAEFTKAGYKISLDDFGTGYANLSWLSKIRPNEIKVDKTFTQSIGTESINQNMLNAIFFMLQKLDVTVVFEGIETQEQLTYLTSLSTDAMGQGWLFAHPMTTDKLENYLEIHHPNFLT
ncbi:putative membrane protein YjcC [Marinomonas spartinae]|uniref:EAL domain-containing protein n=1 Tax=Marinomonas spartinae TaxID=1792290 RepID=UPI000808FD06|nr:EAL domain-containing protein [Marinomonas spartinae]SBS40230.1 putative membrane protein YjcC [Marinomonas spartinae]